MAEPARDPVVTFFGVALLGIGVLMATLSGICTGIALVYGMGGSAAGLSITGIALVVGGVPFAIGLVLAWVGRVMLRPPSPTTKTEDAP